MITIDVVVVISRIWGSINDLLYRLLWLKTYSILGTELYQANDLVIMESQNQVIVKFRDQYGSSMIISIINYLTSKVVNSKSYDFGYD